MPEKAASRSDGNHGWYLYGIVRPGRHPEVHSLRGVDERYDVAILEDGGLGAIVSEISLEEFGEEALPRNLNDPGWLETKVRKHEAVLGALIDSESLVPMRFCTIYRNAEQVRASLSEERERFAAALARVQGKREWGVKAFSDAGALRAWIQRTDERAAGLSAEAAASPAGRSYFARKKLERVLDDESAAVAAAWARQIYETLAGNAVDARANPPQRPEVSGDERQMILNAAYLVDRSRDEEFHTAAAEIAGAYDERGIALDVTGPWPPYNFVPDRTEAAP